MIQFGHTNIITGDWKKLAHFYSTVFDCKPLFPERDLKGVWLDKATAINDAHLTGIHLALPGYGENAPTLEIFQYENNIETSLPPANRKGFGHIAFKVDDVKEMLYKVLANGGAQVGEIVETIIPNAGIITFVYARDPDGNIIELQKWKR
ncbi:MAG: VOC family protein [Ferruginibacter sp.]